MKKILLFALAAVTLMACNGNGGSSAPSKDKKAYATVTSNAKSLFGKSVADVTNVLEDNGYIKAKGELGKARRLNKPAIKAEAEPVEVYFIYGVPENYNEMTPEEGAQWEKDHLKQGGGYIIAIAVFVDGKCVAFYTTSMYGISTDIASIYFTTSDDLYEQLPEKDKALSLEYQGVIAKEEHDSDPALYTEHAKYVTDVKKKIDEGAGLYTYEMAVAIISQDLDGSFYTNILALPTEAEKAEMEKQIGVAYAEIGTVVGMPSFMIGD